VHPKGCLGPESEQSEASEGVLWPARLLDRHQISRSSILFFINPNKGTHNIEIKIGSLLF